MKDMKRIQLIHWNAAESARRANELRSLNYVVASELPGPDALREMKASPPDAVIIDLSRIPTRGRDTALAIRASKKLRSVPLIFVDGDARKVARFKEQVPDATYTEWNQMRLALAKALASPPTEGAKPQSVLAGYSGTPLPKKLGIKPGAIIALADAPPEFETTLGELDRNVQLRRQWKGKRDLTIWFVKSCKDLERGIERMAVLSETGGLWIAWPKLTSGQATDLRESIVRETGLAAGLVDFKICAMDATWSGLRFVKRKPK